MCDSVRLLFFFCFLVPQGKVSKYYFTTYCKAKKKKKIFSVIVST